MAPISNYISGTQSRDRSRNLPTSKMNFKSTVSTIQLYTIIAKNIFLNVKCFLDLLLFHYGNVQKVYTFKC